MSIPNNQKCILHHLLAVNWTYVDFWISQFHKDVAQKTDDDFLVQNTPEITMFNEKSRDSMEWREEASQGDMDKF